MSAEKSEVYRILPYHYIHILDVNTNVTRVEVGPATYVCQEHEELVHGPSKMIIIPPRSYVIIENPIVVDDATGEVVFESDSGQVKVGYGQRDIRLNQPPFPLYPGEKLSSAITPLKMVKKNTALRLCCLQDFADGSRTAGEQWLFKGPALYVPNVNVAVVETVTARIIKHNMALRLRAMQDTTDKDGHKRVTGEEWLVRESGAYLPAVFEAVVSTVDALPLTDCLAVHLTAIEDFTDEFGTKRVSGEQWLVTKQQSESYIPTVHEKKTGDIPISILSSREFCVILHPFNTETGKNRWGARKLVTGPTSFFLHPNERLLRGIEDVYVLSEEEGLILKAHEACVFDGEPKKAGEKWTVRGPMEYVPPVECDVIDRVRALALDKNEGVYVRDLKSGEVRAVIGESIMLSENEVLWEKELPPAIEDLIGGQKGVADSGVSPIRDKTRVVKYCVPHNSAVQIYDYIEKKPRVIFGPQLVMLKPMEMFTPLSLSGGKPKKGNAIRALHLLLGPDFSTDIVTVETSDHARLNLKLSYNWSFDTSSFESDDDATALFSVADFVGDMCNAMASRVRGAVASKSFDEFHKNNAAIIKQAVFGSSQAFLFTANHLVVSEVDIKEIEPVDAKTRVALQSAVQLAIQITTDSQEAGARQEAERLDQEALGELQRAKITDACDAERSRKRLIELQALTRAVETAGLAKAEAQAIAEAAKIGALAAVDEAGLLCEAEETKVESELSADKKGDTDEMEFDGEKNELETKHLQKMADIEVKKFKAMIDAMGAPAIQEMAVSKASKQVAMLQALKLSSSVITDGKSPINLVETAAAFIQSVEKSTATASAEAATGVYTPAPEVTERKTDADLLADHLSEKDEEEEEEVSEDSDFDDEY